MARHKACVVIMNDNDIGSVLSRVRSTSLLSSSNKQSFLFLFVTQLASDNIIYIIFIMEKEEEERKKSVYGVVWW